MGSEPGRLFVAGDAVVVRKTLEAPRLRLDADEADALIGGGAALYFFKFKKPKADTKGGDELDEYDFGEDEDDEDEPTPEDEEPAQDKEE